MSRSRRKPCADHWHRAHTHKKPARKAVRHFIGVIKSGGFYKRLYDLWGYDRKYMADKDDENYEKYKRK
jgi:hypothetical protein